MSGPHAVHGEMPGFFPGRPGGEHDEPLLDMILERRPIPPGAPPEIHGLARMLAAAAGSAGPGKLAGEDAALAKRPRSRRILYAPRASAFRSQIRKLLPTLRCPDDYSLALIVEKLTRQ